MGYSVRNQRWYALAIFSGTGCDSVKDFPFGGKGSSPLGLANAILLLHDWSCKQSSRFDFASSLLHDSISRPFKIHGQRRGKEEITHCRSRERERDSEHRMRQRRGELVITYLALKGRIFLFWTGSCAQGQPTHLPTSIHDYRHITLPTAMVYSPSCRLDLMTVSTHQDNSISGDNDTASKERGENKKEQERACGVEWSNGGMQMKPAGSKKTAILEANRLGQCPMG